MSTRLVCRDSRPFRIDNLNDYLVGSAGGRLRLAVTFIDNLVWSSAAEDPPKGEVN